MNSLKEEKIDEVSFKENKDNLGVNDNKQIKVKPVSKNKSSSKQSPKQISKTKDE